MIDDAARAGLLAQFPLDVAVTVLTRSPAAFAGRPATVVPLDVPAATIADANVIVDGLTEIADPADVLRDLRRVARGARVFALLPNAAFAPALAAFLEGAPLPARRPVVAGDIEPLFAAGGWRVVQRVPLGAGAGASTPFRLEVGSIGFTVADDAVAERLLTAGFIVIAEAS